MSCKSEFLKNVPCRPRFSDLSVTFDPNKFSGYQPYLYTLPRILFGTFGKNYPKSSQEMQRITPYEAGVRRTEGYKRDGWKSLKNIKGKNFPGFQGTWRTWSHTGPWSPPHSR